MFYRSGDGNKARLECILLILATGHLGCVFSSVWIVLVTIALLYTLGFSPTVPSPTAGAAFVVGFVTAWVVIGSVVSIVTIIYSWNRRWRPVKKNCGTGPCNERFCYHPTSLTRCCDEFKRLVNLDTLMPILCQNGVLNAEDVASLVNIRSMPGGTRSYQVLYFVTILEKKGMKGFEGVVDALKKDKDHLGHEELAEILTERHNQDHHNNSARRGPRTKLSIFNV